MVPHYLERHHSLMMVATFMEISASMPNHLAPKSLLMTLDKHFNADDIDNDSVHITITNLIFFKTPLDHKLFNDLMSDWVVLACC